MGGFKTSDVELLKSSEHRAKLATATAKAICAYGGIKWVNEPTTPEPPATDNKIYRVQVGAFKNKVGAIALKKELENKGYKPYIVEEKKV